MTTVVVLMAILVMSTAGASLLLAQKNSYAAVQKIETMEIQYDVSDFCLRKAVDVLKAKASSLPDTSPLQSVAVPVATSDLYSFYFTTQQLSAAAVSTFNLYTRNVNVSCAYSFIKQRPIAGTTSGELTTDRAYQAMGNENVYRVTATACNGSSTSNCRTLKTETNIFLGIQ